MRYLFAVLLAGLVTCVSAVPPQTNSTTSVQGSSKYRLLPSELQQNETVSFLSCITATGVAYRISVDEGTIIISPMEARSIDIFGIDSALRRCISQHPGLSTALESGFPGNGQHQDPRPASETTFESLLAAGAEGRVPVMKNHSTHQIRQVSTFGKREPATFGMYLSQQKDCSSSDYNNNYELGGECYSEASAYKSVQCDNLNTVDEMLCTIWPHHDCMSKDSDDDSRLIAVPADTESACQKRNTYSWSAVNEADK